MTRPSINLLKQGVTETGLTARVGLGLASVLCLSYLLLTFTVHQRMWKALDWDILQVTQAALPRAVDVPFSFLSLVGSAEVTGTVFLIIVWRARAARRLPLFLALGTATLFELMGKTMVYQPVIPQEFLRQVPLLPLFSSLVQPGFAYPSGHALRTAFLGTLFALWLTTSPLPRATKVVLGVLLVIVLVVMFLSRVYLAVHWFTDVVGGALLGAAFAFLAWAIAIDAPQKSKL